MTRRFGIDTSVLVRLITGEPTEHFDYCVRKLRTLVEDQNAEIFASNMVIGEAYIAVQHHYGISKLDARKELSRTLRSGLVAPLNGRSVIDALEACGGPGLFDRLIAEGYSHADVEALTLDQRMSKVPGTRRL